MNHREPWDTLDSAKRWREKEKQNIDAMVQSSREKEGKTQANTTNASELTDFTDLTTTTTTTTTPAVPARNYFNELEGITRRMAFGAAVGTVTGASFGFVDVLRDPKAMIQKASVARDKVIRSSLLFGSFFAVYQGTRKFIKYNFATLPADQNVIASTCLVLTPMLVTPKYRSLAPYAVFLVAVDAFQGMDDI